MNKIENSQISKGERALYFDPAVEAVSHARKRFVSLKWKAFSLSGFLLFIIRFNPYLITLEISFCNRCLRHPERF